MGRGKLTMELIQNQKKREKTFLKRKKGLIKKADEFTTLTGVKMGIIIYGPQIGTAADPPPPPEIWPNDPTQLRAVVDEFNAKRSRGAKTCLLPDYFVKRCKTYRDAANNLRKANYAAKFVRWFDWFNDLSVAEIGAMIGKLDSIHEAAVKRIAVLKNINNQMIVPAEKVGHNYYCSLNHQKQSFLELMVNPEMVPGISSNFMISHSHHQQQHYHEQAQPPQFWAQPNTFEYPSPNYTYQLDGDAAAHFPFSGLVRSATPNELTAPPPLLPAPATYLHHGPSMEALKLGQWQPPPPPPAPPSSMLSIISSHMRFADYCLPEKKRSRFFH